MGVQVDIPLVWAEVWDQEWSQTQAQMQSPVWEGLKPHPGTVAWSVSAREERRCTSARHHTSTSSVAADGSACSPASLCVQTDTNVLQSYFFHNLPHLRSSFFPGCKVSSLKSSSRSGQRLKKKVPEKTSRQGEVGGWHMPAMHHHQPA